MAFAQPIRAAKNSQLFITASNRIMNDCRVFARGYRLHNNRLHCAGARFLKRCVNDRIDRVGMTKTSSANASGSGFDS